MDNSITIIIPGEPRAKGRGRIGLRAGRPMIFTDSKTVWNENNIKAHATTVMAGREPLGIPLYVKVFVYKAMPSSKTKTWRIAALAAKLFPTNKPDIDNYLKSALDGLNGVVWKDDSQVADLYGRKRYSETPHMKIVITPMDGACSNDKASQLRYRDPDQVRMGL